MGPFLLKRVLLMVPTFFGITLLTFGVMHLAPGDPLLLQGDLQPGAHTEEALQALRAEQGLDRPLIQQYAHWVGRVLTLNFGLSSQDDRPVIDKIGEALPKTLLLSTLALFLSYIVAIPLGIISAVKQGTWVDRLITLLVFVLYSLPPFWVAIMLLLYLCGVRGVNWFPVQGLTSDGWESLKLGDQLLDLAWHVVLPLICLSYTALAVISRHMRAGMLENIRQDYIRTARAKGLSERAVLFRHALRNSLIPVITLLGLMLPHLIGGSVIVERIFGIHGMGLLAFEAILARDRAMVMGITTLVAIITMVSLLLSDVLYALVDPRIDAEGRS